MRTWLFFLLALGLAACTPTRNDDDDSAGSDDDDSADDDDAVDDDDSMDDDDSGVDCPAYLAAALADLPTWTTQHSCSNAFFSTGPSDATTRLGLSFNLQQAPDPALGVTWQIVFDGSFEPKNGVSGLLEVQQGSNLFEYDCNDAISVEPVITVELMADEGTATLEVTEYNDTKWWSGTITLSGVWVGNASGIHCAVPDQVWTDVSLGWLPG